MLRYVIRDHVRSLTIECVSENDKRKLNDPNGSEEVPKRQRTEQQCQNKARGLTYRVSKLDEFCPHLIDRIVGGEEKRCATVPACPFLHDVAEYAKRKQADIGETCYIYRTKGHCPRGITCRFGKDHLTEDGHNLIDEDVKRRWEEDRGNRATLNQLQKDVQHLLRKRKYDFEKAAHAVRLAERRIRAERGPDDSDSDRVKLRPEEIKKIDWSNKLYLSPLTTVGNLPFRRICKEFGADVTCGEMAMAHSLLKGQPQEWALVKKHASESIFGVQICGKNEHVMARCAQVLQENAEIDFIDINLGCPIDWVYEQGSGSGLLRRQRILKSVVNSMVGLMEVPLTVKTRTGVSCSKSVARELMPMFRDAGVSLITVHGRSREQRYTRSADWGYIEECAAAASPVPVFGNGDILSYVDYEAALAKCPTVSGAMIGRGALIKPWIFTEIKERRHIDMTSRERLDMLTKYANYGLEHWGSDTKGVETTRRFMLEWLSFLHRYVPVGLLVRPPQAINQRPPFYRGRDELETMMASANCKDWVKISEMLLGRVPDGFTFLPKHKANAWK
ncbi:hypothetical protein AAG570_004966 [Ranatra chinensis]|uniref:tRNA-dihydrouridine(47) synthase [NAD(P)(+)] n=1 Tax=Ranatra chinensis TaxID=642074 RepID=A0ABD0YHE3_9HEMI